MIKVFNSKHLAYILKCGTSEKELMAICDDILSQDAKRLKKHYKENKIVSKSADGKEKIRIINPSIGRLYLIQKKIKSELLDKVVFPEYVQGGVKKRSNISNAAKHLGKRYKFTSDIKKFFPSITPRSVYKALRLHGFIPDIARILTILTTYKGKVPQGAPTSTHIANIVFTQTDQMINGFCADNKLTYTRFVDDISVSSPQDFKKLTPKILNFISEAGFEISNKKSKYKGVLDLTGISVGNNTMKPNEKFYSKLLEPTTDESNAARLQYLMRVKMASKKDFEEQKYPHKSDPNL